MRGIRRYSQRRSHPYRRKFRYVGRGKLHPQYSTRWNPRRSGEEFTKRLKWDTPEEFYDYPYKEPHFLEIEDSWDEMVDIYDPWDEDDMDLPWVENRHYFRRNLYRRNPDPNGKPWGPQLYNPLTDNNRKYKNEGHYNRMILKLRRNPW